MIVAGHQPDLLPYSGFWFKMAHADVFDLKIFDQFQKRGYHRRVLMRDQWASVPVIGSTHLLPIVDVRIDPDQARTALSQVILGRYQKSPNWSTYGPWILDLLTRPRTERLWQFNLELILGVREVLGITTPIAIAPPPSLPGSAGLVQMLGRYGATTYLSGTGGRAYMGELAEFEEADIAVRWSEHRAESGDSILSILMDHPDPMAAVLAEHRPSEKAVS